MTSGNFPQPEPGEIFVFGSNRAGRHGAGAARHAFKNFGAIYGKGEGRMGESYALPTLDGDLSQLTLEQIEKESVARFLSYARAHPEEKFFVTPVGCGLAGFKISEIAPMFRDAPKNCRLPAEFKAVLAGTTTTD